MFETAFVCCQRFAELLEIALHCAEKRTLVLGTLQKSNSMKISVNIPYFPVRCLNAMIDVARMQAATGGRNS